MKFVAVNRIDSLGHIMIPKTIREELDMDTGSEVEFYVQNGTLIVEKYSPECFICGNRVELVDFRNKKVCSECAEGIKGL